MRFGNCIESVCGFLTKRVFIYTVADVMTAEVAILNKQAVALAADSAVTVSGAANRKIYTSANKIFALSKYQPVGLMIYGSAEFMDIPWETVVKLYRNNLSATRFDSVEEYAEDLLRYIEQSGLIQEVKQVERYLFEVQGYFHHIRDAALQEIARIQRKRKVRITAISQVLSRIVSAHHKIWQEAPVLPSFPQRFDRVVRTELADRIEKIIDETFELLPLSKAGRKKLVVCASRMPSRWPAEARYPWISGIVVAGFGREQLFPAIGSYQVLPMLWNRLKWRKDEDNTECVTDKMSACIVAFAERDMVHAFMEGVEPSYQQLIDRLLRDITLNLPAALLDEIPGIAQVKKQKIKDDLTSTMGNRLEEYRQTLADHRAKRNVNPVVEAVKSLPKEELAEMAEALVSLTSLKKRVSMEEQETVGGPVDVAVISKGDGLVWIKRKHYFDRDLNPSFLANYYREETDEGKSN